MEYKTAYNKLYFVLLAGFGAAILGFVTVFCVGLCLPAGRMSTFFLFLGGGLGVSVLVLACVADNIQAKINEGERRMEELVKRGATATPVHDYKLADKHTYGNKSFTD